MKIKLLLGICVVSLSTAASAEYVKRSMPACLTEELLEELQTYAAKNDREGILELFSSGKCTMLRAGDSISVITPGFLVATVRYKGVKLFTPAEAVR